MEYTRGNTPYLCQKALAREMHNIARGMLFEKANPGTEEENGVTLKVYCQNIPVPDSEVKGLESSADTINFIGNEAEDWVLGAPWCNVKIDSGKVQTPGEDQLVTFAIIFCNFCNDPKKNGYEAILNLFQRVYERFSKEPLLDMQYENTGEFNWELQEEDTYPYFFGVIVTKFKVMGIQREGGIWK